MPARRKPRARTRHRAVVAAADYEALLALQGGGCAICGATPKTRRLHIDHDHKAMTVRGLLCHVHNRRLWKGATPAELRRMADYLDHPPAQAGA